MAKSSSDSVKVDSPARSRDEVLQQIKFALIATDPLSLEGHGHGADPYNSRMGSAPREVWGAKRPK